MKHIITKFFATTFLLLMAVGYAHAYDFSAVAPSGHTLYYTISQNYAIVVYPGVNVDNNYDGYSKPTGDVIIPNNVTYNEITYSVISIGSSAFYGCSSLTSVSIPNSVTSIGSSAFNGCSSLTSVSIPNSVTSIGGYAFHRCTELTSVTIPQSVTSIGYAAFNLIPTIYYTGSASGSPWEALSINGYIEDDIVYSDYTKTTLVGYRGTATSVTIPNSVTFVGHHAFYHRNITHITVPDSVLSLGACSFLECDNLKTIIIGKSVTTIGDSAFLRCRNLDSVIMLPTSQPTKHLLSFFLTSTGITFYVPCGSYNNYDNYTPRQVLHHDFEITPLTNDSVMGIAQKVSYSYNYNECNATAIIKATAYYGYHFSKWSNGNTNNPDTLTLKNDSTVTAIFVRNECSIRTASSDISRGITSGDTTAYYLDTVTLVATASYGYHFTRWDDYNTDNPRQVVATGNSTKTAIFDPNQYYINANVENNAYGNCSGSGSYNYLSSCTITANANYGYHFIMWNDSETDNPRTITLTCDTSFTALFERNEYTVITTSNYSNQGTTTGDTTVRYLDTVLLSATANYGYHFSRWNDYNTSNPRQIVVTGNTTKTAVFEPNQYQITATAYNNSYGTCSGSGSYNYLSSRTITANANYGYHFTMWSDGNTANPRTITLTCDTSFTALFDRNSYTISTVSNNATLGTTAGDTIARYLDVIELRAIPSEHHHLVFWDDDYSNDTIRTYTVTTDATITAIFAIDTHSVQVQANNIAYGAVQGGGVFTYGQPATVTATSYSGYTFLKWSNGVTYNPYTFAVTTDIELTAIFVEEGSIYNVTAISSNSSMGTVTGGGPYATGETAVLTVLPYDGYHFTYWNDGNTDNPRSVLVNSDITLVANFEMDFAPVFHITAISADDAMGTVMGSGDYSQGVTVVLNAIPNEGFSFARWQDNNTDNPRSFTATGDATYIAFFENISTQGIDVVKDTRNIVSTAEGMVAITGAESQRIRVYTIDGRTLYDGLASTSIVIPIPTTGIFLLRIGNTQPQKIVIFK